MNMQKYFGYFLMLFLVICCFFSCKEDDRDLLENATFTVGQYYGGGFIFYVDDTKKHGYICAPEDQSTGAPWWNGSFIDTYATATDFGDGEANTEAIVQVQGEGNYAAKICYDLVLNGFDDWYLPSKSECFEMYYNLKLLDDFANFADTLYWSSTEASTNNAYSQYANDGYPPNGGYYKNTLCRVRAIRKF